MNEKEQKRANAQFEKMTTTPVNKLIVSLAIPTVISMLITTIYNVTDTYFVSKISVSASGATGIIFSLMGIIQAFGFMYGQGAGSHVSRQLGAKDIDKARRYCSTAFYLALMTGIMIAIVGLILISPLMKLLGSTDTILPYARIYGTYILICAPAMITSCVMNNILRYEGMARMAMIGLATGGVLNIALDPLLIFGFKLDIAGAGIATAISQYISMIMLISVFLMKKCQTRLSPKYICLKPKFVWEIISTGTPALARQGLNSISVMILNIVAKPYGDACIAAMSIVAKISMMIFSVCVGIGQGFQPVAGFNYGSKLYNRVRQGIKFLWRFGTMTVCAMALIVFIFAPQLVALFRNDAEVVEIGAIALRFQCAAQFFAPTIMTANMTFQSLGKAGKAFFISCCQNGLFFIPLLLILSRLIGVTGIEIAQPIGYVISSFISAPMLLAFLKELKTLENKEKINK